MNPQAFCMTFAAALAWALAGMCADSTMAKPRLGAAAELTKVEHVARASIDASGAYRVLVQIDANEAREFKFRQAPTAAEIDALRAAAIAMKTQQSEAAEKVAAAAKLAKEREAEGKCPQCGQPLPGGEKKE